jgi:hypothetical protein
MVLGHSNIAEGGEEFFHALDGVLGSGCVDFRDRVLEGISDFREVGSLTSIEYQLRFVVHAHFRFLSLS